MVGTWLGLCIAILSLTATSASAASKLAIWSEFVPYAEVERHLDELQKHNLALFIAVTDESLESEDFFHLWAEAKRRQIEIRPWILLSEKEGYWANKWNFTAVADFTMKFLKALEQKGLSTDWITFDIEPTPQLNRELTAKIRKGDFGGFWNTLVDASRNGSIHKAIQSYRSLVGSLHTRGIRVHAVTTPLVLHDFGDRHYRVQSALGIAVQDIPWDEVSFMLYRPEFEALLGPVNSDIVYLYAKRARRYLGEKAAVDLGEVGPVAFPDPKYGYSDPRQLQGDYAASRYAGITNFHVYSLDGLLYERPFEPWFQIPPAKKPSEDIKTRVWLMVLDFLRSLLPKPSPDR